MARFKANYFSHRCMDGECEGEVLQRWPSGAVLVRRIAVHVFPDKFRLFDTLELARQWAEKHGDVIEFHE